MRRNQSTFVHTFSVALSLTMILLTGGSTEFLTQQVEQPAPDFTLPDRSGKSFSLRQFRGQVVLLDLWASWCGPCRMTMPRIQQWHEQYRDQGLKVIGVNIEGPTPRSLNFLETGKYSFLILFDPGDWQSPTAQLYRVSSIPQAFLIDRKGVVRYRGHPLRITDALLQDLLKAKK